ncbi:hypothetical protein J437_LFUL009863 [Ladona fulva]|uniref:E1 domain-containing protein n=1 Tax=Ladona fulva TaxID=123851 RepID=A0A8K0NZQ9_LADFU|nr:hypothetical protein J437_LFUL009863 [Ladona fulva]
MRDINGVRNLLLDYVRHGFFHWHRIGFFDDHFVRFLDDVRDRFRHLIRHLLDDFDVIRFRNWIGNLLCDGDGFDMFMLVVTLSVGSTSENAGATASGSSSASASAPEASASSATASLAASAHFEPQVAMLCDVGGKAAYHNQYMTEGGRWVADTDTKGNGCMKDKMEILEYCKKMLADTQNDLVVG